MTLTMESVTALRKLAGRAGAEAQQEGAAQGGAVEQTPQRDGRPAPGNGNKRHYKRKKNDRDPTSQPATRPHKRGREADERGTSRGTVLHNPLHCGPSHTELNIRNKRRLEVLSRRYPRGHAYNPAHAAGANRRAVRRRHLHGG